MLTIRTATRSDAATLLGLVRALAAYERAPDAVVATEADFVRGLGTEMDALVAEDGGVTVGFALFFPTWSTWRGKPGLHLEDLFVVPEARGRGIGTALLSAVAAEAVRRGCARLDWEVLDWNEPALAFYRTLGASARADWIPMRAEGESLEALGRRAATLKRPGS